MRNANSCLNQNVQRSSHLLAQYLTKGRWHRWWPVWIVRRRPWRACPGEGPPVPCLPCSGRGRAQGLKWRQDPRPAPICFPRGAMGVLPHPSLHPTLERSAHRPSSQGLWRKVPACSCDVRVRVPVPVSTSALLLVSQTFANWRPIPRHQACRLRLSYNIFPGSRLFIFLLLASRAAHFCISANP